MYYFLILLKELKELIHFIEYTFPFLKKNQTRDIIFNYKAKNRIIDASTVIQWIA